MEKKNKTHNKIAAIIVLLSAVVFLIGSIVCCVKDKNIYIEDFICTLGLAVLGVNLLKKRINFYGIAIAAVVGFTVIVDAIFDGKWVVVGVFAVLTCAAIVALTYINNKINKKTEKEEKVSK